MSSQPLISVVMPVYNSERYLQEAIESILNQTFKDFELLIIAGNSTDGTDDILKNFQRKDPRTKVIYQEQNGLVSALNMGCLLAKGKYIARMDADDRCLPNRLKKQVQYMEIHPEIGVLGTWARYIDESGRQIDSACMLTNPKLIGFHLYFANCIIHSSVMMCRAIIKRLSFYNSEALHAEDYELWSRAIDITKISVLPEVLLESRKWSGSVSNLKFDVQKLTVVRIRRSLISKLLGTDVSAESLLTPNMSASSITEIAKQIYEAFSIIGLLYLAYNKTNSLNLFEVIQAGHISIIFFRNICSDILRKNSSQNNILESKL